MKALWISFLLVPVFLLNGCSKKQELKTQKHYFQIGQVVKMSRLEFTVTKIFSVELSKEQAQANPNTGKMLVQVFLKNISKKGIKINTSDMTLIDNNGKHYRGYPQNLQSQLNQKYFPMGDKIRGTLIYNVPKSVKIVSFQYNPSHIKQYAYITKLKK